jgi:hypothetical protein
MKDGRLISGELRSSERRSLRILRTAWGGITRAIESIAATLVRISGCLGKDGLAIFMKGPNCDLEIEEAMQRFGQEYRLLQDLSYNIPHTPTSAAWWSFSGRVSRSGKKRCRL